MNKNELVAAIAQESGLSKVDSASALDATLESISKALKAGEEVRLVGFGTFKVTQTAARTGRHPKTGAEIQIPASKSPKFKAGQGLKDTLN